MLGGIRGEVRFREPLSYHTSLRVGGPADVFVVPQGVEDVQRALAFAARDQLPVLVLGGGTGVIVRDEGFPGVVLRFGGCLERSEFRGEEGLVGGGASLSGVIRAAAAHGLGGLEDLVGIPGTVAGVLMTDSQAKGASLMDAVSVIYFLYPDGTPGEAKRCHWSGVAQVDLPLGALIVGVRLTLHRRKPVEIQRDLSRRMGQCRAMTPIALASAGHVWRAPGGHAPATLIRRTGLVGKRVNGVEIARKDPTFLINRGSARACDVIALIETVRERVQGRYGLRIESRLRLIGASSRGACPPCSQ